MGLVDFARILLSFLRSSLGVSRCIRPLRRRSRPGVSAALRLCCRARIAWGVVGRPRRTAPGLLVGAAVGVRAAEPGVLTMIFPGVAVGATGVRCWGVFGLCRVLPKRASC